ncbi:hypothetical protein A3770_02p13940 [Chloropicon primus]|uniref:Uncharacterized protein n=1 Tax=Chloropicon primus TaxID=1764295 RepID=A0A5B8ME54_9CHLO|nr:hypothetical protein A3770_02p13940 [Chloropicon primus]|eukprot:QDZ18876.1 hypothetical protein A3770_02p13940 [Chloropicon primus]
MVSKKKGSSGRQGKGSGGTGIPTSARRRRPKPAWDNTVHDLGQFKLSKDEQERRKDLFTSRHQMPGMERLRELCEKYEGGREARREAEEEEEEEEVMGGHELDHHQDHHHHQQERHVLRGGPEEAPEQEQGGEQEAADDAREVTSTSRLGNVETFDKMAHHADAYGKLDPHEILFEYRTSNRAQKIVDNIQQIIDINIGRIDTMMAEMNVKTIREEVKGIREDVDDMKETQLVLRDEIKSMRKEFGGLMSTLQRNFQSLLTDKYNPRTQFSARQLESAPYTMPTSASKNALDFSEARSPLPSVPIQARRTPQQSSLFMDGDDDDIELPLYAEMIKNQLK